MECTISKRNYFPGATVTINTRIQNESNKSVDNIQMGVVRHWKLHKSEKMDLCKQYNFSAEFPLKASSSFAAPISLTLPIDLSPTHNSAQLFSMNYLIAVSCMISKSPKLTVYLPIVIFPRPPKEEKTSPPAQPSPQPTVVHVHYHMPPEGAPPSTSAPNFNQPPPNFPTQSTGGNYLTPGPPLGPPPYESKTFSGSPVGSPNPGNYLPGNHIPGNMSGESAPPYPFQEPLYPPMESFAPTAPMATPPPSNKNSMNFSGPPPYPQHPQPFQTESIYDVMPSNTDPSVYSTHCFTH